MNWELLKGTVAGFTGTRDAITSSQRSRLMQFLSCNVPRQLHYGDCTGADYEMFQLASMYGVFTVCHPPDRDTFRMFTSAGEVRRPKPYLVRNADIVDESDYLIACPKDSREQPAGGTWFTVRYARSLGRTIALVYPDGRVDFECPGW